MSRKLVVLALRKKTFLCFLREIPRAANRTARDVLPKFSTFPGIPPDRPSVSFAGPVASDRARDRFRPRPGGRFPAATAETMAGPATIDRSPDRPTIPALVRPPQSIRDDRRGDKTSVRDTPVEIARIEIAREKRERGMLAAWNKYRNKREKRNAENRNKRKSIQSPEDVAKRPAKADGNPEKLDASGWSPEETDALKQGLPALRNAAGRYPNPRRQTKGSRAAGRQNNRGS